MMRKDKLIARLAQATGWGREKCRHAIWPAIARYITDELIEARAQLEMVGPHDPRARVKLRNIGVFSFRKRKGRFVPERRFVASRFIHPIPAHYQPDSWHIKFVPAKDLVYRVLVKDYDTRKPSGPTDRSKG